MTTERRYRRYEDWSNDEIKLTSKEKMAQSPLHTGATMLELQNRAFNDPNGFSYLMAMSSLLPKFPLQLLHGLKSWVQLE